MFGNQPEVAGFTSPEPEGEEVGRGRRLGGGGGRERPLKDDGIGSKTRRMFKVLVLGPSLFFILDLNRSPDSSVAFLQTDLPHV